MTGRVWAEAQNWFRCCGITRGCGPQAQRGLGGEQRWRVLVGQERREHRPPRWVIHPGFMAGLALLRVGVWGCKSSQASALDPAGTLSGLSFPSAQYTFSPGIRCLGRWLWPGHHHGDWNGLTSSQAPRCLGGEWSLGPRPQYRPALERHSPPPAPEASGSHPGPSQGHLPACILSLC